MSRKLKKPIDYREAKCCVNCAHGSSAILGKDKRYNDRVYCQRDRENSLMWIARTGYMVCDGHKRADDG